MWSPRQNSKINQTALGALQDASWSHVGRKMSSKLLSGALRARFYLDFGSPGPRNSMVFLKENDDFHKIDVFAPKCDFGSIFLYFCSPGGTSGASRAPFFAPLGALGDFLGTLEPPRNALGGSLGGSWDDLGHSWASEKVSRHRGTSFSTLLDSIFVVLLQFSHAPRLE